MSKGWIPVWIGLQWGITDQWGVTADQWIALIGLSPLLGHVFSIFLGFRGGKGVATAVGIYLSISPIAVLIELFLFAGILWKWKYISLGSITCALTIPILIAYFRSDAQVYFVMSVIIAGLILYRHQSNISRLLQGTENKWKF